MQDHNFTNKKNVLELLSLIIQFKIEDIVLCPGSRNIPLIDCFVELRQQAGEDNTTDTNQHNKAYFNLYSLTDERSAAFFTMGLSLATNKPTIFCCTSGTALLNAYPAIAEAYYQNIPLLIISADRPKEWLGQMDGQTLPQNNCFANLGVKTYDIPTIKDSQDHWYCNRLINEALLELRKQKPVHINVQINEPLFDFNTSNLPTFVRKIDYITHSNICLPDSFINSLNKYNKILLVVGQLCSHTYSFYGNNKIVCIGEYLSNIENIIHINDNYQLHKDLEPQMVIYVGGHIVNKKLKQFLRNCKPFEVWRIGNEVCDTFCNTTHILDIDNFTFFNLLSTIQLTHSIIANNYKLLWNNAKIDGNNYVSIEEDLTQDLIQHLPPMSVLHLGNSSSVRFGLNSNIPKNIEVLCNRGTSGIDGCVSTACGYATKSKKLNFLIIGDLSFFYDINIIYTANIPSNLKIIVINNGEGGIFKHIKGLNKYKASKFFMGQHNTLLKEAINTNKLIFKQINPKEISNWEIVGRELFHSSNKPVIIEIKLI